MTNLRKLARGQDCTVRVPGFCNGDPATTVLAHYRMLPFNGTGIKPPDWLGAWACSACHSLIDGRARIAGGYDTHALRAMHAEGVLRTIHELVKRGHLKW